jgi:archaellum component FlaC
LSIVAEAMLSRVLEEAVNRIARKVAEDKKLSDQEIVILNLDIIMRTNDKRFEAVDESLESLGRRVELVYNEVSSIKTDIIKMMKEYMERLYGGKKG